MSKHIAKLNMHVSAYFLLIFFGVLTSGCKTEKTCETLGMVGEIPVLDEVAKEHRAHTMGGAGVAASRRWAMESSVLCADAGTPKCDYETRQRLMSETSFEQLVEIQKRHNNCFYLSSNRLAIRCRLERSTPSNRAASA